MDDYKKFYDVENKDVIEEGINLSSYLYIIDWLTLLEKICKWNTQITNKKILPIMKCKKTIFHVKTIKWTNWNRIMLNFSILLNSRKNINLNTERCQEVRRFFKDKTSIRTSSNAFFLINDFFHFNKLSLLVWSYTA